MHKKGVYIQLLCAIKQSKMPIQKFGQYFIEIESPKLGSELVLDGIDGFDDQTLWNFKKGDKIQFIINPDPPSKLLNHDYLITEVLEDTENNDWAKVKIIKITSLMEVYESKESEDKNDFLELLKWMQRIWDKGWEMKQKFENYRYHLIHNHFLNFSELQEVNDSEIIEVNRQNRGLSKIYAKKIQNEFIRVISITSNYPESCFIYDISNIELYKSEIIKMKNRNQREDETKFWNNIIIN